jgi:hypothetical protein
LGKNASVTALLLPNFIPSPPLEGNCYLTKEQVDEMLSHHNSLPNLKYFCKTFFLRIFSFNIIDGFDEENLKK